MKNMLETLACPAVMLDADGSLLAANDQFVTSALVDDQENPEFVPQRWGKQVAAAFAAACDGQPAITHWLVDNSQDSEINGNADWQAIFVPQGAAGVLVILQSRFKDMAYKDQLTGLPNRRDASERLKVEWGRLGRSGDYRFSLAMADIDHFKRINDSYGHDVGDEVLRMVAACLSQSLRTGDWVARWAGEEFLMLFHNVGLPKAEKIADRIREQLAATSFKHGDLDLELSISMGVVDSANYGGKVEAGEDLMSMIHDADVLLYDAKLDGRNRCASQLSGQKVFWDRPSFDRLLASSALAVFPDQLVRGAGNTPAGVFWRAEIADAGLHGLRHVYRSAVMLNQLNPFNEAWLEAIGAEVGSNGGFAGANFVRMAARTLAELADNKKLIEKARSCATNDGQLVLTVRSDDLIDEVLDGVASGCQAVNAQLCIELNDPSTLPAGLISRLAPRYLAVNTACEKSMLVDLQGILQERGIDLVLPNRSTAKLPPADNVLQQAT